MKIVVIPPKDKLDYLAETIVEGLYKNEMDVYSSDTGNGIRKEDVYSDEQILEHSKDCDYIFVIWGKIRDQFPGPKYHLVDEINKKDKTVYIDGSEWTYTGWPEGGQLVESRTTDVTRRRGNGWINESMYEKSKWYFKRECYDQDLDRGIIPLLFGSVDRNFYHESVEKEYDIFCSYGHTNEGLRSETLNLCTKLKDEGYNVILDKGLPYNEFKEKLKSSWIAIDAWGGGDCCARLFEILANNTMAMTQEYNIKFPMDFTDGENIVKYKTIEEFETKIRGYLKDKSETQRISENGYQHLLKYHTAQKRAQYILEIINE